MSSPNPFAALVRMLEQRIARQKQSVVDSELQLAAARESYLRVEDENSKQKDLLRPRK